MDPINLVGGIIVFAMVAIAVYAVVLQRRAMTTQTSAVSKTLPAQQAGWRGNKKGWLCAGES